MMNKNTAILDNTMMDAYLTVTEGCPITAALAWLLQACSRAQEELCQPEQPPRCQCKLCRLIFSNLPVEDSPSFFVTAAATL